MRSLALLLILTLLSTVGCDSRQRTSAKAPRSYSGAVDAPPSPLSAERAKDMLAPKASPVHAAPAAKSATPAATPADGTGAPAGAPADQAAADEVKAVLKQMRDAMAAKQGDLPLEFFAEADQAALKPVAQEVEQLKTAIDKFAEAAKAKNLPLPRDMTNKFSETPMLSIGDVDAMKFEQVGENVVAVGGGDRKSFVKTPAGWKGTFTPAEREMIPSLVEFISAARRMIDEATAGVTDGSITAENIGPKMQQLGEKHVVPVMMKLMGEMAAKGIGAMMGGQPASQEAPKN
jgi:hypothetical protein